MVFPIPLKKAAFIVTKREAKGPLSRNPKVTEFRVRCCLRDVKEREEKRERERREKRERK